MKINQTMKKMIYLFIVMAMMIPLILIPTSTTVSALEGRQWHDSNCNFVIYVTDPYAGIFKGFVHIGVAAGCEVYQCYHIPCPYCSGAAAVYVYSDTIRHTGVCPQPYSP